MVGELFTSLSALVGHVAHMLLFAILGSFSVIGGSEKGIRNGTTINVDLLSYCGR
ncbi:hypothetical protein KIN20_020359 [Parelaphostrongylus tenuis]|uniref:Uncharacterized protein n=1 Tax=Parelaphostrongylus tenuis TaxID=148309 RepID=A0AAD5QVH8_PARTN|nr:hypothetical protein KIN20_020359 [Parelaphostrongylus tenuis]